MYNLISPQKITSYFLYAKAALGAPLSWCYLIIGPIFRIMRVPSNDQ